MSSTPPKKILLIKTRPLGDTVLLFTSLDLVRRVWPQAKIDVLVMEAWSSLFEDDPRIRKVWKFVRHPNSAARAKAVARLAIPLFREKYDAVLNFHASPSSSALAFATRAPLRAVHFHGPKDQNRYSTVVIPGKGTLKTLLHRDIDVVRALGLSIQDDRVSGLLPRVVIRDSGRTFAGEYLQQWGGAGLESKQNPLLVLGPAASRPTKVWPMDSMVRLAQEWMTVRRGFVLACFGPNEISEARDFQRRVDGTNSSGVQERFRIEVGMSLPHLAAVISRAAIFVGNDAGPKHLAAAVGVPTVTLFGPEDPFEWHFYPQDQHRVLYRRELSCRKDQLPGYPPWCSLDECVVEKHRCLEGISWKEVWDEVIHVLNRGVNNK